MILQTLGDYYQRKCQDPDPAERLPRFGMEQKEIPFILEVNSAGQLLGLHDTRVVVGKKSMAQSFRVPIGAKKTSGIVANLLWDTAEYVLGIDTKGKPGRVQGQHQAFLARIAALPLAVQMDAGVTAVTRYLNSLDLSELQSHSVWSELLESNGVPSFRLQGDSQLVCQRPLVVQAAVRSFEAADARMAVCLVTGDLAPVERLHTSIKGVWGAQTAGANIVSFNARAFESYGKTDRQGENAPVSRAAAFAYTTALNHLLRKGSRQRLQIGDASTVFWTEEQDGFERVFGDIFSENAQDSTLAVQELTQAVQSDAWSGAAGGRLFHVLGLAPNAARISIRFYHALPLRDVGARILQHLEDLRIARATYDPQYPSLFRLLVSVAVQNKAENIPPNLGGGIVDAIFAGADVPYPSLWLNAAVGRCRAEQNVNYFRAAAIKASLNRHIRAQSLSSVYQPLEKEFLAMLDVSNPNPAYRLGRTFAVLERIQQEATPGMNASICDRYYGAASSTPVTVFTTLLRMKNTHLKKLSSGRTATFEKLLGEVLDPVVDFPRHMPLRDQGRFALGYYHQRQDFFSRKSDEVNHSATAVMEGMHA